MAPVGGTQGEPPRPRPLQNVKSWSRIESETAGRPAQSQRASTAPNGTIGMGDNQDEATTPRDKNSTMPPNAFEKSSGEDASRASVEITGRASMDLHELPIELVSLTDSFIDSLSAKVHRAPPSVDKLSSLFQDFYAVAAAHISTHISTLSSRQHRGTSPAPSALSSTASKFRAKAASFSTKDRPKVAPEEKGPEQMMLTADEIADRKRARKVLEQKRVALEEAVERRVCEGIYDRIWRHRSTQDEAQDEKLRSKTAALAVVGIGLTDLGVDVGQQSSGNAEEKEGEVREWLEQARQDLTAMSDQKYPLGKLQHLKAAHKSIVDTLSHFHPSSSADEIMPMLIYTLITSRPEGINVISNLYFIQRFRNESKVDGEAAYCLTNLEAAITFLETVDLASLREDEVPSGPQKPTTPGLDRPDQMTLPPSGPSAPAVTSANANPELSKPPPSPSSLRPGTHSNNRRISDMFQPPAQALGAASDTVFKNADQGFKNLGNSLGESYKFLLRKLKERQEDPHSPAADLVVPKTLDEARKLVSSPPPDDDGSVSGGSSANSPDPAERTRGDPPPKPEASTPGGKKMVREGSTDSAASSGRRVAFAEEADKPTPTPPASGSSNPALVESMRSLGSTLNPMNRIAGMGFARGFGRPAQQQQQQQAAAKPVEVAGAAESPTAFPELVSEPQPQPREVARVAPPVKRFMEVKNPGELRINEVLELLRDYRRLAGALKDAGAF